MKMHDQWIFPHAKPLTKSAKTLIMGIVNITPDSFSGQNAAPTSDAAVALAERLVEDGADMIDIGAESSRPGADTVSAEEELRRLGDSVKQLRERLSVPLSVDTYHWETARAVLDQGADMINDISALRGGWTEEALSETRTASLVADAGAHVVLMHCPEVASVMQLRPEYRDVVAEVREFLQERLEFAERSGISRDKIWLDPGFGFGKALPHNRELLLHLDVFENLGFPVLAGLSRKRMISDILHVDVDERLEGSLALAVIAALHGAAVLRVHDVKETARAVAVADAMKTA